MFTTSGFGPEKKKEIEAMIKAMGGGFQSSFNAAVTHIVTLSEDSEKVKAAKERNAMEGKEVVKIVACDWLEVFMNPL